MPEDEILNWDGVPPVDVAEWSCEVVDICPLGDTAEAPAAADDDVDDDVTWAGGNEYTE